MRDQLQKIFNFSKEIYTDYDTELPNNAVFKEMQDVFHYEFDSTFIKNLEKFKTSNLKAAIDQIKEHLNHKNKDASYASNDSLINELSEYFNLFQRLATTFDQFIESINGHKGFNEKEARQYSILINFTNNKHNINFYEQINKLINNSFKVIKSIKELHSNTIDFNILLNTARYLQEFIQKNYLSTVYQRQASTTAAMLIKNEQLFFRAMNFALPDFILEVKIQFFQFLFLLIINNFSIFRSLKTIK